jgi:hypothetical protein
VIDSYGLLSVALDQRSAAAELGLAAGASVHLEPFDDDQESPVSIGVVSPVELRPRPDHTSGEQEMPS